MQCVACGVAYDASKPQQSYFGQSKSRRGLMHALKEYQNEHITPVTTTVESLQRGTTRVPVQSTSGFAIGDQILLGGVEVRHGHLSHRGFMEETQRMHCRG
eukprot:2392002-Amphidinium_carterae.1